MDFRRVFIAFGRILMHFLDSVAGKDSFRGELTPKTPPLNTSMSLTESAMIDRVGYMGASASEIQKQFSDRDSDLIPLPLD